jgi:glycosyltransferase involved in cell wall biosynthesis
VIAGDTLSATRCAAQPSPARAVEVTVSSRHLAIVPAYNEAAAIAGTVADIYAHTDFDVLVIDDGSTDGTAEAAAGTGAAVLRHPFNLGIGGAVQSGYLYALERGYDVAVQVDGDGQHDARHIPELLAYLRATPELNMVTGSRFIEIQGGAYRSSGTRRMGIRLFSWILSRVVGRRVTDPTSGFRMVDAHGIELFARDYPHDYPEVEAVLLLHYHKLEGAEMPVRMRARTTGVSSINAQRSVYYMIKVLLAILVGLLRARPAVEAGDAAPVTAEHTI